MEIGALIWMYIGVLGGLSGWYFGRKKARKNRGLDEMYEQIWQTARSFSWYATLFAIYIVLTLSMMGMELSVAPVVSILLATHLGSWGIVGAIQSIRMSSEEEPDHLLKFVGGLALGVGSTILFVTLTIATGDYRYLVIMPLPLLIGIIISIQAKKSARPL
ncbi:MULTISPECIES: hypothetical protein [Pontibacillus]|uniref:Uncharacterized protein n=1 Tax=Pontibacillus chungwhensis TaxID=265426 RepID=A0ABY8V118_9BACI|nr:MULTISPECIES: hypothetical protein [Pontibacillus]MCD5325786.1 hypothetical protein [Pontibacillus sp. HN14]WIF98319.1 hypothetical protein QNI29_01130 [Pontibacillus chungwhensis]